MRNNLDKKLISFNHLLMTTYLVEIVAKIKQSNQLSEKEELVCSGTT